MNRRLEVRFGANQHVVVSVMGHSPMKSVPGKIAGASKSGIRIFLGVPIEANSRVEVQWDAGTLMGETRYCRRLLPDRYSVGLKITRVIKSSKLRTHQLESAFD